MCSNQMGGYLFWHARDRCNAIESFQKIQVSVYMVKSHKPGSPHSRSKDAHATIHENLWVFIQPDLKYIQSCIWIKIIKNSWYRHTSYTKFINAMTDRI